MFVSDQTTSKKHSEDYEARKKKYETTPEKKQPYTRMLSGIKKIWIVMLNMDNYDYVFWRF